MNRREFLRRAGLIAAGVVAADQLELLERLAPRSLFAAWPTQRLMYATVRVRTGLPPVAWRLLHEGVPATKAHIEVRKMMVPIESMPMRRLVA